VFKPLVLACLVLIVGAALAAEPAVHDPTEPYRPGAGGAGGTAGAPAPRFKLTAVLISPTRRVAIVNGKPLQEGQRVAGAELVKIDAHSVQLRDGNRDFVVQLGDTSAGAPRTEGDSAP
jgi:hypothetical protein